MSQFYDQASLVIVPSGYKAGTVYAQKPLTTDGQLAFTRTGDTATRVNSAGLIEKVRTNLLLQSQTLDNATWSKLSSTITANATAAPNGTTTADRNIESASLDEHGVSQVLSISAGLNTISVSVKANGRTRCRIGFANSNYGGMTSDQRFAYFDVSTGTIVQNISGGSSTIVSEGNGWYRCSVSQNLVAGNASGAVQLLFIDSGVNTFYTGNGTSGLFLWGAQLETGDIATPYIPTLTAAVSTGPTANVPRLDYLGSTCGKLLLEPQRTNLAIYSDQAAKYTLSAITIGSNVAVSPDGYKNADSIIEDGTTGSHAFYNFSLTTFTAVPYTASVYAKKGSRNWVALQLYYGTSHLAYFNLNTGTVGTVAAGATATITNVGNGWYRCTITATAAANTGGIAIYAANADNSISYTGTNGLTSAYFYGWQLELGSYSTSYVPTLAASATRGADFAYKTGISSLIGTSAGTIFIDCFGRPTDFNSRILTITGGAEEFLIFMEPSATGNIGLFGTYSGLQYIAFGGANDTRYKIAYAWSANNYALYVNGVAISLTQSASVYSALSRIDLNQAQSGAEKGKTVVNQALLFKTRLTNAALAELTTL